MHAFLWSLCATSAAATGYELRKFVTAMEGTCEDLTPDGQKIPNLDGCRKAAVKLNVSAYPDIDILKTNSAWQPPGCNINRQYLQFNSRQSSNRKFSAWFTGICSIAHGPQCLVSNGTSANPHDCLCGLAPCINSTGFHCLASASSCTQHAVCDNADATMPLSRNCRW